MTETGAGDRVFQTSRGKDNPREDDRLVQECLNGSEAAWFELIDKYKNLIFSIPIKYGFTPEDANDIFQDVCSTLVSDLMRLRNPRALAGWLIQITLHLCIRWRKERQRYRETPEEELQNFESLEIPDDLLRELEREFIVRESLAELPEDCRRLLNLLFYEDPPVSYEHAANRLGLAKGSIGATRGRCLAKLRSALEKRGFR
jgi:RNA polymerase sigma factor (sigma-70 family)